MADSLNLATLNVAVQASGVQETQRDIDNLTSSVQQSGSATQQSTSSMSSAFNSLRSSVTDTINNTQIFGTTIGNLRTQLSSGQGATALLQGAITGLTSALINMAMQGLSKVIGSLKDFVGRGIELASDLTEIQNVLDAAFGESAEEVNEWSTTVASAYGLTEIQAKQYSSTIGSILSGMNITGQQALVMSEQMAQLTGDMASFYNLDHDAAFEKIKSGLTGETEPLKSLGIVMNETNLSTFAMQEGIEKAYSQMSESEKVILRYNYLINQTSLAHGDFAKTQDSYANISASLENNLDAMSAKMGETLLPTLSQAKTMFNDLVIAMTPIMTYLTQLVSTILRNFLSTMEPTIAIIKVLAATLKPIYELMTDIVAVIGEIVSKVYGSVASVVTKFAEAMGIIQKNTAETAEYTTETIVDETNKALGYVTDAIDKWVDDQMKEYEEKIRSRYGDSGSLANEIKIQEQLQRHEARLRESAESTQRAYENAEANKQKAIEETTKAIEEQQKAQEKNTSSLKDMLKATVDILSGGLTSGLRIGYDSFKSLITGKYATGTLYHTGGLAIVGENGRELIDLPRGARVYTNRETENIVSGGNNSTSNNNFYISINASDLREINDVVEMCNTYKQTVRMGV